MAVHATADAFLPTMQNQKTAQGLDPASPRTLVVTEGEAIAQTPLSDCVYLSPWKAPIRIENTESQLRKS